MSRKKKLKWVELSQIFSAIPLGRWAECFLDGLGLGWDDEPNSLLVMVGTSRLGAKLAKRMRARRVNCVLVNEVHVVCLLSSV